MWLRNTKVTDLAAIPALHQAVLNSLTVGIASAIVATILGIGAARAMTRYEFAGRGAVSAFLMVPMVMPEIIVAVALLVILLQLGFELSVVTAAHIGDGQLAFGIGALSQLEMKSWLVGFEGRVERYQALSEGEVEAALELGLLVGRRFDFGWSALDLTADTVELGNSVLGTSIVAERYGTPGGRRVLVIGVIHGDEDAGVEIVRRLAVADVPAGIDLWLVESINPDGQAAGMRTNANLVDLNRNFPRRWAPLGQPGEWQYAGTGPASEPETQAIVGLIELIQPDLGIWYHQDLFRIAPADGRAGEIRRRYAELTGLPIVPITGGTYTGTAASWQRAAIPEGVSFIVELGPTLSPAEADAHARAVFAVATGA